MNETEITRTDLPATTGTPPSLAARPDPPGEALARATQGVTAMIEDLVTVARAEAAVGPAATVAGRTLVPLASVQVAAAWGLGFGSGAGDNIAAPETSNASGSGSGGGAGGAGRGNARIIAVAEVSDTGVRVMPVIDRTALGLGLMALIGLFFLRRRGGGRNVRRHLFGALEAP